MPRNIQCPHCGVVLTVPDGAAGRRLKCPQCQEIFKAEGGPARPPSKAPGVGESRPASSLYSAPVMRDVDIPTSEGPLRDLLDIPLLSDDPPAKPGKSGSASSDAMALFRDDPAPKRKKTSAEARSVSRPCPTCRRIVPAGMSLCNHCGLDLDTGIRIGIDEDLDTVPTAPRSSGMPMTVLLAGMLFIALSLGLSVASIVGWSKGITGSEFLLIICLFGVYASVQFTRMKTVKLLFVALTLGVMIDVIAMIALPVYNAVTDVETFQTAADPDNSDDEGLRIKSMKDSLDVNKLTWGIAIVFSYAAVSVYLNSPPVKRHFDRR